MSYAIPLPARPRLDFYKKLAKELLHAASDTSAGTSTEDAVRAWAVRWLEASGCFREAMQSGATDAEGTRVADRAEWVEGRWHKWRKKKGAAPLLADAQFFLAREHGFLSWPKFAAQVRALEHTQSPVTSFEAAVEAIVEGDEQTLAALLRKDPALAKARSLREHHSTLLHYCSANGVEDFRQRTPGNIVAIARMLLDAGADVNAESEAYGGSSTTLVLTATSVHPERVGVQIRLMELLLDRGAAMDVGKGSDVVACLRNGRAAAAAFLSGKGARLDLEGAAGVGALDTVKAFFAEDGGLKAPATAQQLADGFGWACEFGRVAMVEFLLRHGVRAEEALSGDGLIGLHLAALGGHTEVVRILLAHGADVNAQETRFDGTPVTWAVYGWSNRAPNDDGDRYCEVVAVLVQAGASVTRLKGVTANPAMLAALHGEVQG
jgi:Ankyrin repeats (3 copies)